jgi:hypothetical protein
MQTALERLLCAYEELYQLMRVWKYGGVVRLIDPLGPVLFPGHDIIYGFSAEDTALMHELHRAIQTELDQLPDGRASITYAVVQAGDKYDPLLHRDIHGSSGETIAKVKWRGLAGHSVTYVTCVYAVAPAVKALYEFMASCDLPTGLVRFLFQSEVSQILSAFDTFVPGNIPTFNEFLSRQMHTRTKLRSICQQIMVSFYNTIGADGGAAFEESHRGVAFNDQGPNALNDLVVIVRLLQAIRILMGGPCLVNRMLTNTRQRCIGFSRRILPYSMVNDIYETSCDTDVICGMPDRPIDKHELSGTLVICQGSFASMLECVRLKAHLFIYRVDMRECHTLKLHEIDRLVDAIRIRCPFVQHLICRLSVLINVIPYSFHAWESLVVQDLSLSSGLFCERVGSGVFPNDANRYKAYRAFRLLGPHRQNSPPMSCTKRTESTDVEVRSVRLVSRLARNSRVSLRDILPMFGTIDTITLDDGAIVQAIATSAGSQDFRHLITLYGDRDELFSIVPPCEKRLAQKSAMCKNCQSVRRIGRGEGPQSFLEEGCLVSCPNACITPIARAAHSGRYVDYGYRDDDDTADIDGVPLNDDDPESCPPLLKASILDNDQIDEDRQADFDSPRRQCLVCLSRLRSLSPGVFPLCTSRCVGRRERMQRVCKDRTCKACVHESLESNVFCLSVDLRRRGWRDEFAREVMVLINLRGFNFDAIVVVDDTGCGAGATSLVAEATVFIHLLLDSVSTPVVTVSDLQQKVYRVLGPINRAGVLMTLSPDVDCGKWIVAFVMTERNKTGMGVLSIEEIAAACPIAGGVVTPSLLHVLHGLDRIGIIRVIGTHVFLSMRHYALFVKLARTRALDMGGVVDRDMVPYVRRAFDQSYFLHGEMSYNQRCLDLITFLKAKVRDGDAPDFVSMIQILLISRRADLFSKLSLM